MFSSLNFQQIDLSYYDLYGSLKLVLVNQSKLPANQEVSALFQVCWFAINQLNND